MAESAGFLSGVADSSARASENTRAIKIAEFDFMKKSVYRRREGEIV
jgi:hypothetical protein